MRSIRSKWKRIAVNAVALSLMLGLAACGNLQNEEASVESSTYQVLEQEVNENLLPDQVGENLQLLSTQFYNGEVIQFWGEKNREETGKEETNVGNTNVGEVNTGANGSWDIYQYEADGTGRLLFDEIALPHSAGWYQALDGTFFAMSGEEVSKVDSSGNIIYTVPAVKGSFHDICQLAHGKIFLLKLEDEGTMKLVELNADSGELSQLDHVALGEDAMQFIATGERGLLWMNTEGIWQIDPANGSKEMLLNLADNDYQLNAYVEDFRMTGQHSVEMLREGNVEKLELAEVSQEKTVITMRSTSLDDYIKKYADMFNQSNDKYFVVLEEPEKGESGNDFSKRSSVEIATGGGPDIICWNLVDSEEELIEKGVFEDLAPYMAKSGIKEEDFFPAAFGSWRDGGKIYGVNLYARVDGMIIYKELLGDNSSPGMEELVDAILNYPEPACFMTTWEAEQLLDYFLKSSEDLWGMLDREKGICDFSGELFAKMLEAAKKVGFDEEKDVPVLAEARLHGFYSYETNAQLESEGKVSVGYIFEDGCYLSMNRTGTMAINSNSDEEHKEGAWAFLAFLLGDEVQLNLRFNLYPSKKSAFDTAAVRELEEGAIGTKVGVDGVPGRVYKAGGDDWERLNGDVEAYRELHDLKEEEVAEIREELENARHLPLGLEAIIAIISEEAMEYFYGTKSIEDVAAVIENRVQLYLDEKG